MVYNVSRETILKYLLQAITNVSRETIIIAVRQQTFHIIEKFFLLLYILVMFAGKH